MVRADPGKWTRLESRPQAFVYFRFDNFSIPLRLSPTFHLNHSALAVDKSYLRLVAPTPSRAFIFAANKPLWHLSSVAVLALVHSI